MFFGGALLATIRREQGEGSRLDELQALSEKQRAAVSLAEAENVLSAAWKRMQFSTDTYLSKKVVVDCRQHSNVMLAQIQRWSR